MKSARAPLCVVCLRRVCRKASSGLILLVVQTSFTMLMGIDGMNNGINYDPMNPMNQHSWRKDAKAANRIAGLVTK